MTMKKLLFILACLISISAFAQPNTEGINKTDANGRKQGPWKKYEKGKLVYVGQFKDNVPYGTFQYYFPNGKLKSESEFIQGVHKVKTIIYHENGKKASEGIFIDQIKDGPWKYYANNSMLIKEEDYTMGKKSGCWKTYSSHDGVLLEEEHYANGKLNGVHKTYYTDGAVSLEENYLEGKQNGLCTAYYPKGKVSSSGNYLKGYRDGEWNFYDVNGKQRSTVVYKDKKLDKTYVYLYQKGAGQKINQDMIAYFQKNGEKTTAVLRNGNKIVFDETFDEVILWADFMVFTKITPSILAATDAIVGYKEVEDSDGIIVKLRPRTNDGVYSEGNEAKMVKALFNKEMPKE